MKTILITGLCVSVFANLLFIIYIFLGCRKIYREDSIGKYVRGNINNEMGKENEKMYVDSLPKFVKPVKETFKYTGSDKFYRPK